MAPTDTNIDAEPQIEVKESSRGGLGNVLQSVGTFTGRIFFRDNRRGDREDNRGDNRGDDRQKSLSPPVILMDMQRYEPKGLVGMTMRVLRRRFFNLWARPPPSWTNAVGQADPDVPGTFVSRKRRKQPVKLNNIETTIVERSKFRRAKDAVQSSFLTVTWPIRKLAGGALGRDYSDDSNENQKDGSTDDYLMQASSSTQLGIFGRRKIEKEGEGKG